MRHQAVCGEEPVFVAISPKPLPAVVAILVGIAHGDAIVRKGPQFLDEPVFVFLVPLAGQESLRFLPIGGEFDAVAPAGVDRVGQSDLRCIARVPTVFGQADLFDGGFAGERGSGGRVTVFPFVI